MIGDGDPNEGPPRSMRRPVVLVRTPSPISMSPRSHHRRAPFDLHPTGIQDTEYTADVFVGWLTTEHEWFSRSHLPLDGPLDRVSALNVRCDFATLIGCSRYRWCSATSITIG